MRRAPYTLCEATLFLLFTIAVVFQLHLVQTYTATAHSTYVEKNGVQYSARSDDTDRHKQEPTIVALTQTAEKSIVSEELFIENSVDDNTGTPVVKNETLQSEVRGVSTENAKSDSQQEHNDDELEQEVPPVSLHAIPVPTTEAQTEDWNADILTRFIHEATNDARDSKNHSELVYDTELSRLAKNRSEDMAKHNYFSHTAPNGCDLDCHFTTSGYDALSWGENIAWYEPYDYLSTRKLAEKLVSDWLKSKGHRENLLSESFTHEGVGVALDGNRVIVTVLFARP